MTSQSVVPGIFFVAYLALMIGVAAFWLVMTWRFVTAHERLAKSLDVIAKKMRDESGA